MAKHQSTATMVNGSKVNETMMATGAEHQSTMVVAWWGGGGCVHLVGTGLEEGDVESLQCPTITM